ELALPQPGHPDAHPTRPHRRPPGRAPHTAPPPATPTRTPHGPTAGHPDAHRRRLATAMRAATQAAAGPTTRAPTATPSDLSEAGSVIRHWGTWRRYLVVRFPNRGSSSQPSRQIGRGRSRSALGRRGCGNAEGEAAGATAWTTADAAVALWIWHLIRSADQGQDL